MFKRRFFCFCLDSALLIDTRSYIRFPPPPGGMCRKKKERRFKIRPRMYWHGRRPFKSPERNEWSKNVSWSSVALSTFLDDRLRRFPAELLIISHTFKEMLLHLFSVALSSGVGEQCGTDSRQRIQRLHHPLVQPQHQRAHLRGHGDLRQRWVEPLKVFFFFPSHQDLVR